MAVAEDAAVAASFETAAFTADFGDAAPFTAADFGDTAAAAADAAAADAAAADADTESEGGEVVAAPAEALAAFDRRDAEKPGGAEGSLSLDGRVGTFRVILQSKHKLMTASSL
jgi:hypothetical protein